jgi:hypothetical protein
MKQHSSPCHSRTHRHAALKSQQLYRQPLCTGLKLFPYFSLIIRNTEKYFKQKPVCPNKIRILPCTVLVITSSRITSTVNDCIPNFDFRGVVSEIRYPNGQARPSYYAHMSRMHFVKSTHEIGSALTRMA